MKRKHDRWSGKWFAGLTLIAAFGLGTGMALAAPPTTGLQAWYKADTGVTTDGSGNVSQWNDQSGNGNHATQGTANMRPALSSATMPIGSSMAVITYGGNGDGSYDRLSLPSIQQDGGSGATVYFVANDDADGAVSTKNWMNRSAPSSPYAPGLYGRSSASTKAGAYYNTGWNGEAGPIPSGWKVTRFSWDTNAFTTFITNYASSVGASATGPVPLSKTQWVAIGLEGYGQHTFASFAEILIYNRALDASERAQVEDYLKARYFLGVAGAADVENRPATNVTATAAHLNGFLVSTGESATAVSVYWGETDGTTNAAAWHTNALVSANSATGAVTYLTSGTEALTADRTYYYRYYAANDGGGVWAEPSESFITGEVTIEATQPDASEDGPVNGVFTVTRPATATGMPLTVAFTVSGTAGLGPDYTLSATNSVTIPQGSQTATITAVPKPDGETDPGETVILTLAAGNYPIGTPSSSTVTIANVSYPPAPTNTWIASAAGNASDSANWSLGHAPTNGETVLLAVFSTKDMTWDAAAASNVTTWVQTTDYTGTVTFATVYGTNGFTTFTVSGDMTVSGGAVTHLPNAGSETYRLDLAVGGNLTVGTGARFDVDGKGYTSGGPGASALAGSAAHGGIGTGAYGGIPSDYCYGSFTSPTNLGSAGLWGNAGGGAIRLSVNGVSTINGILSARGKQGEDTYGASSGGSVLLTTGYLEGNGIIRANGGTGRACGGGGRVAVILTAGTSFGSVTNQACGATGWWESSAAGTVYRQTATQGSGQGELIIDNNGMVPRDRSTALAPAGSNLGDLSRIVITNQGSFGITSNGVALNLGTAAINGSGASSARLMVYAPGASVTYPNPFTISGYTLVLDDPLTYTGHWTVASSGGLSHSANAASEVYKLDLTIAGSLTVEAGGRIQADGKGYGALSGPGTGSGYAGGTHGGMGVGVYGGVPSIATYGSILDPTNLGSGGSAVGGGGAIRLTVNGLTTVNGTVSADGSGNSYGPGAGGSVFLTTGTLAGNGTIRANGGWVGDIRAGAGGGRVAVILTAGTDFASVTNQARASSGSYSGAGSAGTVYLQPAGAMAGAGTVIVDNGSAATNFTFTPLPAFTNSTEAIQKTAWVSTNNARLGMVTNAAVGSLTLNANGTLELNGYTLTVQALTITNRVFSSGTYAVADLGPLVSDSSAGQTGRLVVLGRFSGAVILIR